MKKKGVIYSCITGNYDDLIEHTYVNPEVDYVLFADNDTVVSNPRSIWQVKKTVYNQLDVVRNQRWHKLHPHLILPEYQYSLYVDGNIDILNETLFENVSRLRSAGIRMSLPAHAKRDCLYTELDRCVELGKDRESIMRSQVALMKNDGYPKNNGLFENNIIYRMHHDSEIISIMHDWWQWIRHYSRRDQLSFVYVLWKHRYTVLPLPDGPFRNRSGIRLVNGDRHVTREELQKMQQQKANPGAASRVLPRIKKILKSLLPD